MILWIVLLIVVLILAVLLVAGWKISDVMLNPKSSTPPEQWHDEEFKMYHLSWEDWNKNWHRQDFTLKSRFGYELSCSYLPRKAELVPADGRERVVVMVHGFGVDRLCGLKYANMFRDFGFNVVLYDHRNHGRSGKAPTTMGAREAQDLETVCAWAREKWGKDCLLGTHGESMGGATVMVHSGMDHNLAFVVEDCGYSSVMKQLLHVMSKDYNFSKAMLPVSIFVACLRCGTRVDKLVPAEGVANSGNTPMLFIHGEEDDFVPFAMLQENYDAKTTGPKMKKTFPGAAHARSFATDPAAYRATVHDFLVHNHILSA